MADVLEERMIKALRDSNLIEHFMMDSILDECDEAAIRNLLKKPHTISCDRSGIYFMDGDDRVECPNFAINISANGEWLSSKLPDVPFDVEQSGNIRKSIESESAYCCCIVALVLNDPSFFDELDEVIKGYDFHVMNSKGDAKNFKDLLTTWQDLQSNIIGVCISAAKYKISSLKKDIEKFLRSGIPDDLVVELRSLDITIKNINRTYSTGVLSPINIKNLTKIDVLQHLVCE